MGDPRETISTLEEASTLAKRWGHARSVAVITRAARSDISLTMRIALTGAESVLRIEPLTDTERGGLVAWVLAWLSQYAPIGDWPEHERDEKSAWLAEALGLTDEQGRTLADAAGWP